ncbi:unnamed protein product [Anisakis simplex]|uniref:Ubiquitin carboxyl-terminal hydrolase n=1 Tax=Anisakis simplex TaxID=6269 RepID=A0A0M3JT26_ANISI|nr:unnamed protein product [Anisakis simplex]
MGHNIKDVKECIHKNKKSLFKSSEVRKKLKSNLKRNISNDFCEECVRLASKSPFPAVWLCVSCGYMGCDSDKEQHALKHCRAVRSGVEHSLFFSPANKTFRCFSCEVNVDVVEEGNHPMKSFINEYNSFMKTKSKSDDHLMADAASTTNSTSEEQSSSNTMPISSATKIINSSKKEKDKDKKRIAKSFIENSLKKEDKKGAFVPVRGLVNLGNTCFFNSIVQCMLHTKALSLYVELVGKQTSVDIPSMKVFIADKAIQVPSVHLELEPFNGPLNEHFAYFLRDFLAEKALHPSSLFSEIAKKAPRFRGWAQQDAHELLRYLLDGLRSEELNRYKAAISDHLKLPKNVTSRSVQPDIVVLAKGMLKGCGRPLLDAVFGGTLLQTVKCSKCGHLSRTFEEMLDLSLPLPSTSSRTVFGASAYRMHKSASATLSKHQKKKEKANARKRNRRKSHGESVSVDGNNEANHVNETNLDMSGEMPNIDDDDDDLNDNDGNDDLQNDNGISSSKEDLCDNLNKSMKLNGDEDIDECSLLLSDTPIDDCASTLSSCLKAFTATETLSAPNTYECEKCCLPYNKKICNGLKKRSVEASKRYLVYEPPAVLTLHLKRFEQRVANGSKEVLYSLYGVVSHSGDLSGGHYVAYVRSRSKSQIANKFFVEALNSSQNHFFTSNGVNRNAQSEENDCASPESSSALCKGEWYYASDSRISIVPESRVLAAEAYILFYERVL